MQPNTAHTRHQTNPPDRPPDPAELLETVTRALAAALIPLPRQAGPPSTERAADFLTAAQLARRLGIPGDSTAARDHRDAAAHRSVPRHPQDNPPVPPAVRRRLRGQRPGHRRPGRVRRPVAGAGHRARTVTARTPGPRIPAPPAPPPGGWRYQAACRGANLNLSFPGRGESAEPARRICARCPVREPCLDYGLRHGITHGIWGGLAERDRRALRSQRVGAARRERDEAITAASGAGYSQAVIGRTLGLTRTSVSRVLSRGADGRGRS